MKTIIRAVSTAALLSTVYAGTAFADSYTVQKGDSLSKIALKYGTTVTELKNLNDLKSDLIFVNQQLKVSAAPAAEAPAPVVTTTSATEYTVVRGDFLGKIAQRFGTTVANLKSWNGLNSDLIFPGQRLKVSEQTTVVTPPPTVQPPAPSTPAPTPTTSEYTVISGDYLGKIALQYGTTVDKLKSLNGLTSHMIYVGQKLKVSGNSASAVTPPPAVTTPTPAKPAPATTDAIEVAKSLVGIPYVWGGSSVNGFDCSGFIYYVLNKSGKKIGRYSAAGYYSRAYYVDNPQPGDLVFFENTYKPGISHMGIYLGNNEFIHADAKGVTITNLNNPYYKKHFDGFKKFY